MAAVWRSRKRFEALRSFTLDSGQEEIERLEQLRKDASDRDSARSPTRVPRNPSLESLRSPLSARPPTLSNVPEEGGAFAVGDDDSDAEDHELLPTPSQSSVSNQNSRTPSVSSMDDAVPTQLRGMSEKARGKMPVGTPTFSRVNSMTSVTSHSGVLSAQSTGFQPTAAWVSHLLSTFLLSSSLLSSPFSQVSSSQLY